MEVWWWLSESDFSKQSDVIGKIGFPAAEEKPKKAPESPRSIAPETPPRKYEYILKKIKDIKRRSSRLFPVPRQTVKCLAEWWNSGVWQHEGRRRFNARKHSDGSNHNLQAATPPVANAGQSHNRCGKTNKMSPIPSFPSASEASDGFDGYSSSDSALLNGNHSFLGSYFQSFDSSGMDFSHASPTVAPKASSSSMYRSAAGTPQPPRPRRRLRSQYPAAAQEPHVEFILVASFDIDRGSIMEFQYPNSISGDEHMLAELMLPDQVHNRSQDWTIFFLHKDANADEQEDEEQAAARMEQRQNKRQRLDATRDDEAREALEEEVEEDDEKAIEGPPLIYVLNLVNTKHDETVRR